MWPSSEFGKFFLSPFNLKIYCSVRKLGSVAPYRASVGAVVFEEAGGTEVVQFQSGCSM